MRSVLLQKLSVLKLSSESSAVQNCTYIFTTCQDNHPRLVSEPPSPAPRRLGILTSGLLPVRQRHVAACVSERLAPGSIHHLYNLSSSSQLPSITSIEEHQGKIGVLAGAIISYFSSFFPQVFAALLSIIPAICTFSSAYSPSFRKGHPDFGGYPRGAFRCCCCRPSVVRLSRV